MSSAPQDPAWPLPKFNFSVSITGLADNIAFQAVNGLDAPETPVEYRAGNSKAFSTAKMPGIHLPSNVTLKKGVFINDNTFWDWFSQIKLNTIKRQSVTIRLLDQSGTPSMTWHLANAWPTRITGTDLKSDTTKVAVDSIEFAYETLTHQSG